MDDSNVTLNNPGRTFKQGRYTPLLQQTLIRAGEIAADLGHAYVGTEHVLLAFLRMEHGIASHLCKENGMSYQDVFDRLFKEEENRRKRILSVLDGTALDDDVKS